MKSRSFRTGELVWLNSEMDGRPMTIEGVDETQCTCTWLNTNGELQRATLHAACLTNRTAINFDFTPCDQDQRTKQLSRWVGKGPLIPVLYGLRLSLQESPAVPIKSETPSRWRVELTKTVCLTFGLCIGKISDVEIEDGIGCTDEECREFIVDEMEQLVNDLKWSPASIGEY